MKSLILLFCLLICTITTQGQPPLSKKMQKKMDAWLKEEAEKEAYQAGLFSADSLFRLHQYNEAITAYEKVLKIRPKDPFTVAKITDLKILMANDIPEEKPALDTPIEADSVVAETIPTPQPPKPILPPTTPSTPAIKEAPPVKPIAKQEEAVNPPITQDSPKPANTTRKPATEKPKLQPVARQPQKASLTKPVKEEPVLDANGNPYPEGITEEITELKTKTIIKRIVVKGQQTSVYQKIRHTWGGVFYFKDEFSISERVWLEETEK